MRAVLDANVLIAALLSAGGAPGELLSRWRAGEFELIVSEALLDEVERALAYPKLRSRIEPEEAADFVELLRRVAVVIADPAEPPKRAADPRDDYLLALAERAGAVLISGDRHLLDVADRFPIRSPREFLDERR